MSLQLLKKLGYRPLAICLLSAQLFTLSSVSFAKSGGVIGGGGGDATELRVNEIRSDILEWLNTEGPKGLIFPPALSYGEYVSKMKDILQPKKVIIGFVEKDDSTNDELQVSVNGTPKTCRGFFSRKDQAPHILCNIERFKNTSESEQYKLIHHEYAGLVKVENNEGPASDYALSSQITDFLVKQTVLKLAIKKQTSYPGTTLPGTSLAKYLDGNIKSITLIKADGLVIPPNQFEVFLAPKQKVPSIFSVESTYYTHFDGCIIYMKEASPKARIIPFNTSYDGTSLHVSAIVPDMANQTVHINFPSSSSISSIQCSQRMGPITKLKSSTPMHSDTLLCTSELSDKYNDWPVKPNLCWTIPDLQINKVKDLLEGVFSLELSNALETY
jgi:hypothetical protein